MTDADNTTAGAQSALDIAASFYYDNPDAIRPPDAEGLAYWANEIVTKSVEQARSDFNWAVANYWRQVAEQQATQAAIEANNAAKAAAAAIQSATPATADAAIALSNTADQAAIDADNAKRAAAEAAAQEYALAVESATAAANQKVIEGHVTTAAIQGAYDRALVLSWYANNPLATKTPDDADLQYWANEITTKSVEQARADFNWAVAAYWRQVAEQQATQAAIEANNAAKAAAAAIQSATPATAGAAVALSNTADQAAIDADNAKRAAAEAAAREYALAVESATAAANQKAIEGHVTTAAIQGAYDRALVLSWYANNPLATKTPDDAAINYWVSQLGTKTDAEVQADFDWAVANTTSVTTTPVKATQVFTTPTPTTTTVKSTTTVVSTPSDTKTQSVLFSVNNPVSNTMSDADKRALVLSWYANNPNATKSPDESAIAYWVGQLKFKSTAQVFTDFTNSVNAVVAAKPVGMSSGMLRILAAVGAYLFLGGNS